MCHDINYRRKPLCFIPHVYSRYCDEDIVFVLRTLYKPNMVYFSITSHIDGYIIMKYPIDFPQYSIDVLDCWDLFAICLVSVFKQLDVCELHCIKTTVCTKHLIIMKMLMRMYALKIKPFRFSKVLKKPPKKCLRIDSEISQRGRIWERFLGARDAIYDYFSFITAAFMRLNFGSVRSY